MKNPNSLKSHSPFSVKLVARWPILEDVALRVLYITVMIGADSGSEINSEPNSARHKLEHPPLLFAFYTTF